MQTSTQRSLSFSSKDILEAINRGINLDENGFNNKLAYENRAFHDWYRFVLSFPPQLVDHYIKEFGLQKGDVLLDPFCGTGTSVVEAKLKGIESVGIEANPFAHYASSVKINWNVAPSILLTKANEIADECIRIFRSQGIDDNNLTHAHISPDKLNKLEAEAMDLILTDSISPLPLHKVLVLRDLIEKQKGENYYDHMRLALANALVFSISNLRFGPEVGVGKRKKDVSVVSNWLDQVNKVTHDLQMVYGYPYPDSNVLFADARHISGIVPPNSINAVITSPPYPNEKDYTRTTRLESVILGFIRNKEDLRNLKKGLVRSNTRGVYKSDTDDLWVQNHAEIQEIAEQIEKRRISLGKTSGFEKLYGRVTKLYFGGMARHLSELRSILQPNANLAYVVGDQASYLRIMIRTGKLLAEIAQALGYEVVRIDLFRKRFATATKQELREEVVILKWKG